MSLPLRYLHPFYHNLINVHGLSFTKFLWPHFCGLLSGSWVHTPTVSYFFCSSTNIWFFIPVPMLSTFCVFAMLSSPLAVFLFKWSIFAKRYHQETQKQHICTRCCLCVSWQTDARWPITAEVQEVTWLVADHEAQFCFVFIECDTWYEELASEFVPCAITHCQHTMVT